MSNKNTDPVTTDKKQDKNIKSSLSDKLEERKKESTTLTVPNSTQRGGRPSK